MRDFERRVEEERDELDSKIDKLSTFLEGDMFSGLTEREQKLLLQQQKVMVIYSSILTTRMSLFSNDDEENNDV